MSVPSLARFKQCSVCCIVWPSSVNYFHRRTRSRDGLCAYCKVCTRGAARLYRAKKQKTKKPRRPRASKYEDPSDKHAVYRAKNKDKARAYYLANKERIKDQSRAWQRNNPERRQAMQRVRLEALGEHTGEEIIQMYNDQQGLCAYCDIPLFGAYHVDHMIPLSKGGGNDWRNLAVTCPTCNMRKHAKTVEEFFNMKV